MNPKWFYNFDGLRFFAALFVVLGHIEGVKNDFQLPSLYNHNRFFTNTGQLSVTFFFVLSGFLITYLLMLEQKRGEANGKRISVLKFYRSRILRIWPLYYVLVLLVYFLFPFIPLFHTLNRAELLPLDYKGLPFYLSFCPNLADYLYSNSNKIYLGQTWSLSVEEFFYLFFPAGLYFISSGRVIKYFFILLVVSVTVFIISHVRCNVPEFADSFSCIFIFKYKIYAFALGAMSAYYYTQTSDKEFSPVRLRQFKLFGYFLFAITLLLLLFGITFSFLTHPLYALIFAALIFTLAISDIRVRLLNYPSVIYLGKISYGIYMLHPVAIIICIKLFYFDTGNVFFNTLVFDMISVAVTIILSACSYRFLEKPFLRMKNKA